MLFSLLLAAALPPYAIQIFSSSLSPSWLASAHGLQRCLSSLCILFPQFILLFCLFVSCLDISVVACVKRHAVCAAPS
eukprot:m.28098 g.28098  ORF g.28098 m.28098 type:complete len:78 (-) comp4888_c0_seq1:245-478(-)